MAEELCEKWPTVTTHLNQCPISPVIIVKKEVVLETSPQILEKLL